MPPAPAAIFMPAKAIIGPVLVLAAATVAEYGALRLHALGRGLQHLHQIRHGAVLVVAVYSGLHSLTGERVGDEYDPVINSAYAITLVGELLYRKLYLLVILEGNGNKLARGIHGVLLYYCSAGLVWPSMFSGSCRGSLGERRPRCSAAFGAGAALSPALAASSGGAKRPMRSPVRPGIVVVVGVV